MLPVMTRAQRRARQNRDAGLPPEAYDPDVAKGDEVRVETVSDEPFCVETFAAQVLSSLDCGDYVLVNYRRSDTQEIGQARIFRAGPPDWGVTEFTAIHRAGRREPEPQTCPLCLAWYTHSSRATCCPRCERERQCQS